MNTGTIALVAIAASAGYVVGSSALPVAMAQGHVCVECLAGANEVVLTSRHGAEIGVLVIGESSIAVKNMNGNVLFDSANVRSIPPMPPLQPVVRTDQKADAATQASVQSLQNQVDAVAARVDELTTRLNTMTN